MNCTISGANVKVFGKAIQTLSKVGDELFIEATLDHMVFKTVSSSRSAFASFKFVSSYFCDYQLTNEQKCKLPVKSILLAFKSLTAIDKSVERCHLDLNNEDTLLLRIYCKYGLIKSFHLPLLESESFTAQFDQNLCFSIIKAHSKLLSDGAHNFSFGVEEVSLTANDKKFVLRNYVEDEPDLTKVVHTELSFEIEEFETYSILENVELTFCMKELRAIISFAESFNALIEFHFHTSGKPILFKINPMAGVDADFVLATLSDDLSTQTTGVTTQTQMSKRSSKTKGNSRPVSQRSQQDISHITPSTSQNIPFPSQSTQSSQVLTHADREFKKYFLGLSENAEYSVLSSNAEVLVEGSDDEEKEN